MTLSLGTELVNCYICFAVNKILSWFAEHPNPMCLVCFIPHRHTLWVWKGLHFRYFAVFFVEIANFNKDYVAHSYFVGFVHNLLVSIFRFFFDSYIYTYVKEV